MSLDTACEKGKMSVEDFLDFINGAPVMRTHVLEKGDYVVSPNIIDDRFLRLEKIAELDYLEPGDFRTEKGTTGPISGCVFIKLGTESHPDRFIEGDRVYDGEGSVYDLVRKHKELAAALGH